MAEIDTKASESTNNWTFRGTPMLTTYDNPYNPFEDFTKWYLFDTLHHHDCCGYLDRTALTSTSFTDEENAYQIELAIDDLIAVDCLHIYRKVFSDSFENPDFDKSEET